jgi:hypothetical protein
MKRIFTRSVIVVLFLSASFSLSAQTAPVFSFVSPTLDSGTNLSAGAVYRFANVTTGVDAFVKVVAISSGMTLRDIDRTADGYGVAFQPEYRVSANTNGYIDFRITFVNSGTSTPVSQALVSATGLDIDGNINSGNTLKEYNRIDMGGGTSEYNSFSSELIISQTGTAFTGANNTGNLFGVLVDTSAKEVMYTVTNANVSVINYRVGANNQTSSNSPRYASLYFKKFTYQHFPLALTGLMNLQGNIQGNNIALSWELSNGKYRQVVLERSYHSTDFTAVTSFDINGTQTRFEHTDRGLEAGNVFYRLRALTETGKTEYSQVILFRIGNENRDQMKVFPTLVQSTATLSIAVPERTNAGLMVTDFSGKIMKQQTLVLNAGTNNISLDGFERMPRGNYIVALRTTKGVLSKQIIVQ